jgi:hypothetical protein
MKKVITVLVMIVISLSAFSQSVISTSSSRIGKWNALTEEWNFDSWTSNNITFTSTSTGMSVNDNANSYYTFTSPRKMTKGKLNSGKSYTAYIWNCLDENLVVCTFVLSFYGVKQDDFKISVMYSNMSIEYTIL